MTVTAPPRPPRPPRRSDPVEHPDPEALIEEARQRARRRRRMYGAAAAVLALIGVSLFVVFGRPESSQSASPEPPALLVPRSDETATTIVAHYGGPPDGKVIVYADGRVIRSDWDSSSPLFERRLTAVGLDRVRSGAVQPIALLMGPLLPASVPADTWADSKFEPYVPTRYAVCRGDGGEATRALHRLPASARALLRGKERTYTNIDVLDRQNLGQTPVECFEVTAREASAIDGAIRWPDFMIAPIFPHGAPVLVYGA